jgi:hypothetical protein
MIRVLYDKTFKVKKMMNEFDQSNLKLNFMLLSSHLPLTSDEIIRGSENDLVVDVYSKEIRKYEEFLLKACDEQELNVEVVRCICIAKWRGNHKYGKTKLEVFGELVQIGIDEKTYLKAFDGYVNEVMSLIHNTNWSLFVPAKSLIFSGSIGGVISGSFDLIIDDCIIDVKTNLDYGLKRSNLNQVLCYFFLMKIYGLDKEKYEINKIGIYLARYNYLWIYDFRKLDGLDELVKEFKEHIITIGSSTDIRKVSPVLKKMYKDANKDIRKYVTQLEAQSYYGRTRSEVELEFMK